MACSPENADPCLPVVELVSSTSYSQGSFSSGRVTFYNDCIYAISQVYSDGRDVVFIPDEERLPAEYQVEGFEVLFKGWISIVSGPEGIYYFISDYEIKLAE